MIRSATFATFWALSDPVRVEIVDRVAAGSETTVTELAAAMPMSRQAVTRHVRTLQDAALLVGEQDGREHHYRVDVAALEDSRRWLEARASSWENALGRLADYLEEGTSEDQERKAR